MKTPHKRLALSCSRRSQRISATFASTRATQPSPVLSCRRLHVQTNNFTELGKIRDPRPDFRSINMEITTTARMVHQTIFAFTIAVKHTHRQIERKSVANGHATEFLLEKLGTDRNRSDPSLKKPAHQRYIRQRRYSKIY